MKVAEIELSESYSSFETPPPIGDYLPVNLSFNLLQIREINEVEGTHVIKWAFTREWSDGRLTFIGMNRTSKIVPKYRDGKNKIWIPWTILSNIKHQGTLYESDKLDVYMAKFKKGYKSTESRHEGSNVVIEYSRELIAELMCNYDMFWYPFDSQACSVELYQDEEDVQLLPGGLTYSGPQQLAQYWVERVSLCPGILEVRSAPDRVTAPQGRAGLVVTVRLSRPLLTSLLTVFLPTIILTAITFLVNAFSRDNVALVIKVNLTVLLVLSTL
jgi:hypothetical protein